MTVRVRGGRARVDYAEPDGVSLVYYALYDAASDRAAFVLPSERKYVPFDSGTMGKTFRDVPMHFSDVTAFRDSLGTGETLLDFPTRRFRIGMAYAVSMGSDSSLSLVGGALSVKTEMENVLQVSDVVLALAPGFRVLGGVLSAPYASAMFSADSAMIRASSLTRPPRGVPLDTRSVMRTIHDGDTTTVATTTRLTSLVRGGVRAEDLLLPVSYSVAGFLELGRAQLEADQRQKKPE